MSSLTTQSIIPTTHKKEAGDAVKHINTKNQISTDSINTEDEAETTPLSMSAVAYDAAEQAAESTVTSKVKPAKSVKSKIAIKANSSLNEKKNDSIKVEETPVKKPENNVAKTLLAKKGNGSQPMHSTPTATPTATPTKSILKTSKSPIRNKRTITIRSPVVSPSPKKASPKKSIISVGLNPTKNGKGSFSAPISTENESTSKLDMSTCGEIYHKNYAKGQPQPSNWDEEKIAKAQSKSYDRLHSENLRFRSEIHSLKRTVLDIQRNGEMRNYEFAEKTQELIKKIQSLECKLDETRGDLELRVTELNTEKKENEKLSATIQTIEEENHGHKEENRALKQEKELNETVLKNEIITKEKYTFLISICSAFLLILSLCGIYYYRSQAVQYWERLQEMSANSKWNLKSVTSMFGNRQNKDSEEL